MKRTQLIYWAKCAVVLSAIPAIIYANSSGAEPRRTGAPGDQTCAISGCHIGTAVNGGTGKVEITYSGGTSYTPGTKGKFTVTVTDTGTPAARLFGFQASTRLASNATNGQAGRLEEPNSTVYVECEDGSERARNSGQNCRAGQLEFITHAAARSTGTYEFDWTPPADGSAGNVNVYVAGNAANGNGQADRGDRIYTSSITLTPAAATSNRPSISSGGVADAFTFRAGLAANMWTAIFGSNLSTETRTWDGAPEFGQGRLPTTLGGVSVSINGKAAPVFFVSPGQVNVLSPIDDATGNVQVVVTNSNGVSTPATVVKSGVFPAFYAPFGQNGRLFVTSVENSTGAILGKPGVEPRANRGVRVGDIVQFYATGLGATSPAVDNTRLLQGAPAVVNTPTITINNVNVELFGAVLVGSGLYQINARIPATLTPGDHPIVMTVAGQTSASNVSITVSQ